MIPDHRYFNPPKCRQCGHTICPNVWACCNPACPKHADPPRTQLDAIGTTGGKATVETTKRTP